MKIYNSYYPFTVAAETKTSKAGKEYTSISVCHKGKDKDGNKKDTYFNLIDEKDLLVLASACENLYHHIMKAKSDEFLASKEETHEPVQETVQDSWSPNVEGSTDEIPF